MKSRNLLIGTFCLTIGLILHLLAPGIFFGMKPDFLLLMFFLAIRLCGSLQEAIALSIVAGVLSSLSTVFPGGQVANLLDKAITGPIIFFLIQKVPVKHKMAKDLVIPFVGTFISGTLFLEVMSIMGFLPGNIFQFMLLVVLPTALVNTVCYQFMIKIMDSRIIGNKITKKS